MSRRLSNSTFWRQVFDTIRPLRPEEKRPQYRFNYRDVKSRTSRNQRVIGETLQCIGYTWILWHCYYHFGHLVGYDFPDPSVWTDEELGIPPIVIED